MTTPRRRIQRNARGGSSSHQGTPASRIRPAIRTAERLDQEWQEFNRWMARLKRAFHQIEKRHRRLVGLERELRRAAAPPPSDS